MFQNFIQSLTRRIGRESSMWGLLRLCAVLLVLAGMALWSSTINLDPKHFPWILFSFSGLRYWIFPLVGFIGALLLAAHYMRDLFELASIRHGVRHVIAILFGMSLPSATIEQGAIALQQDKVNLLERIGGPGVIDVAPGNLVLLENQQGPSNVYGSGYHYVSRREFIKSIARLEDQHGYIESTKATTKDGIEITVREVRYHYRLKPSRRYGEYIPRSPQDPFPYSNLSMRNYTYHRTVSTLGLTPLPMAVNFIVDGVITDYVCEHQFDHIVDPPIGVDPRAEIRRNFDLERIKDRFRDLGMELLWVDIGHFDVSEEVWQQRLETWEAKWEGAANIAREDGETRRQTYRRLARAQGRADALTQMIAELSKARAEGATRENIQDLVMLYTAQILEEMTDTRQMPGGDQPKRLNSAAPPK
jgi:hypothetical protein